MPDDEKNSEETPKGLVFKEEEPSVTHHEILVNGKKLNYTATVGRMPFKDEKEDRKSVV